MSFIFLIGMPGCGKTHWAKRLKNFAGKIVDTDKLIKIKAGKTIEEIFEEDGEDEFRVLETTILREIIADNTDGLTIVACGGGTPVYNNNIELMKANGCVIYLKADEHFLTPRLSLSKTSRPLLKGGDLSERLNNLLTLREPFYEQAHYILDARTVQQHDFEKIITICTKQQ